MKRDSVIKSIVLIGGSTIVNLILSGLTTPIITRLVAPNEYGEWAIFTMYTNLAIMILGLGLDQSFVRFYYEDQADSYKNILLRECVTLPLVLAIVVLGFAYVLVHSGVIFIEFDTLVVLLLTINIIGSLIYRFLALMLRLDYENRIYAKLNIASKGIYVLVAIWLLLGIKINGVYSLTIATTISSVIVMFIAALVKKKRLLSSKMNFRQCLPAKHLLIYGYPFIFSMGISVLFQSMDKIVLDWYCSYFEVGIYSAAMSIIQIIMLVQSTFNTIWLPISVEHYTTKPQDSRFFYNVFERVTTIMFFLGISVIFFKDICTFILGGKYEQVVFIVPVLIFSPVMLTVSECTVCGIDFVKKSRLHVIISMAACITNFIGNITLIPELGSKGAAISTGIAYIVFFSMRTFLAEQCYKVGYELRKFYGLTVVVFIYAIYNTFYEFNVWTIIGAIVSYLLLVIWYKEAILWIWAYCARKVKHIISDKG